MEKLTKDLRWRSVGPHRGGRSTAAVGVRTQPNVFYMGATGGGVWKTENYGITWLPIADGQIATGSIGAIDVSDSNPSVVYVSAFDAGLWRRDAGAARTAFSQVFKPQFYQGLGVDRLMFAMTVKNETLVRLGNRSWDSISSPIDARSSSSRPSSTSIAH